MFRPSSFSPALLALSLACWGIAACPSLAVSSPIAQAESPVATPSPIQPLRPGDQGAAVIALQEKLKKLGFFSGESDGDYGTKTQTAVAAFQDSKNLVADGIAGETTLAKIDDAIAASETASEATTETDDNPEETQKPPRKSNRFLLIGGAVATFVLGSVGLIIMLSIFSKAMQPPQLPED
ncbi:MAG: peptidoglycan-binding domain-containing protein, partial [Jaaginema sp. PMC 1079.18]|nr:peptidoglycan-binding domain-containing protein [Jaaginema sp. PMC 1079.18]